jgi:hypothetical protein
LAYTHLPAAKINDAEIRRVFVHASAMLADVYTMLEFGVNPPPRTNGGRCNFSIALVLACVLDGLATEIDPIVPSNDQYQRLRSLVHRLSPEWGTRKYRWITADEAAKVLWTEIRNPLVHNLGADTRPNVRRAKHSDAAVVHPMRDRTLLTPDDVEAVVDWPECWPIMWAKGKDEPGKRRLVVALPALYWHVKRLARTMALDEQMLKAALQLRKRGKVRR